jgi:hypothetical protein
LNGPTDHTLKEDRKKDSQASYHGGYKHENQNGDNHGSRGKGKDKSKQGKQTQVKPVAPKPENKFNLEADFPTLVGSHFDN